MDSCCEVEEPPLLIAIQILADLRAILAIVGVLGGNLDRINMSALSGICRPLNRRSRPTDTCDNTVEELELGNEEVIE